MRHAFRFFLLALLLSGIIPPALSLQEERTVTYSFMHLSDLQSLTAGYPGTLDLTFSSIESMKDAWNISAIIITGDVVNTWNDKEAWDTYAHARKLTTVPVYEIAGNHDTETPLNAFNEDDRTRGTGNRYYTLYTGEPETNYAAFVGDLDFVGINYAAKSLPAEEFSRIRAILAGSTRSYAIIATHSYMDGKGNLSPLGNDMDANLVVKPTLVLMGHSHGNFIRKRMVGGFPIVAGMTNYQDGVPGGTTGWDYSAGTLYTVTSGNGQVIKITARIVRIYPVPSVENPVTIFSRDPGVPVSAGDIRQVSTEAPVSPADVCSGDLFCILKISGQQGWTDLRHLLS